MSVSPQSLAKTRDKRSHKVPARFNDTVYVLKDIIEPVRTSSRSRPGSLSSKRDHDEEEEDHSDEEEEAPKVVKPQNSTKKQTKSTSHNESATSSTRLPIDHTSPNSPTTPPSSKTPSPLPVPQVPVSANQLKPKKTPKQPTTQDGNSANKTQDSSASPTPPKKKKKSNKGASLISKPNMNEQGKQPQSSKQGDTIKTTNSKQKPTATISGGVSNFNIHQSSHPIQPATVTTPIIVANGTTQAVPPMSTPVLQTLASPLMTSASPLPAPRQFHNLATNQQYASRLLLNEPILLPRSVATVAPITATLHQIALRAQKPPFISKKAEACLAYQSQHRLNFIASNHIAMIKIAKYLGVTDRLNLRCVNQTWKSVVDNSTVWKSVRITSGDSKIRWKSLNSQFLRKFETSEIIFDGFELPDKSLQQSIYEFGFQQKNQLPGLKRIYFKTLNKEQNAVALNVLEGLRRSRLEMNAGEAPTIEFIWDVKVGVDPAGIPTVDFIWPLLIVKPVDEPNMKSDCGWDFYDLKEDHEHNPDVKVVMRPI